MMTTQAQAAVAQDGDWERALEAVLGQTTGVAEHGGGIDLAFLFASASYGDDLPVLVRRARSATGARVLVGCSGQGIIGPSREIEGEPAVALLSLSLPGAELHGVRLTQSAIEERLRPGEWYEATGVDPDAAHAWFVFADPFTINPEELVAALSAGYPGLPLIGGLASGEPRVQRTLVFLDDEVYPDGAVAVALGGAYTVRTVVSQGAEPISEPWTITAVDGQRIQTIAQRPALDVLVESVRRLPPEARQRAERNLLIGLAMDEYRDDFGRGDFLIRNLAGADPKTGQVAIGALPRVGQTIQFQLRDAEAADEELRELLAREKASHGDNPPLAAVLCSCNARGAGLFGTPDHDALALAEQLDIDPVAGFFCNGEIGPVGERNFLHGYTASIALIVPAE
jgi:small ligand-binding sensory domain FIST